MFNVGSVQGYLKLNTTGWSTSMRSATAQVTALSRTFARMGAVVVGSLFLIEREFGKFDKAIRHATSVSETTSIQFKEMSEMALDASVRWNKAAASTAQAFYFLGSAGLTVTEQMQAFNSTIMLSRAMGSELGQTVEGVVDIVRAFGLEFADIDSIADQVTKTIISSNQQFRTLSQALSYAASTARLTNNTLAETTAMLGVMANAGIKGSMAGTVLRRAMTNLMSPTGAMAGLIYELGLNIYDATGRMKPFIEIMGDISDRLMGATDEYKNMIFEVLFGRRAIAGQIVLFNYGSDALRKYANEIKNAAGTTERVAGKQMKAFTEVLGQLWRTMQRVAITVGETLAPAIERLANTIRERLTAFRGYVEANKAAIAETLKWTAAIGAMALIVPPMLMIMAALVASLLTLITPFTVIVAVLYTFRAVWKETFRKGGELNKNLDEFTIVLKKWLEESFGVVGKALIMIVQGWGLILGYSMKGWEEIFSLISGIEAPEGEARFGNVVEAGKKAASEVGKVVKDQLKEDMKSIAAAIEGILPEGMGKALKSIRQLLKAFMTEPEPFLVETGKWLERFNEKLSESSRRWRELHEPVRTAGKMIGGVARGWEEALRKIFRPPPGEGETWGKSFVTMLTGIESAWADAFDNLMEKGSSFKDFMDELFWGVLNSFKRMIAQIIAHQLLYSLVGGEAGMLVGTPRIGEFIRRMLFGERGGAYAPGISLGGRAETGLRLNYEEPVKAYTPGIRGKAVPGVAINITNTGSPANMRVTSQHFDGNRYIVNAVLEELNADPSFRDRIRG